jgi:hypothetical protein
MKRRFAILLLGLAASASVALGQARLGPYVVDSNGLKVGHAQDSTDVLIFIGGEPATIAATRSGFQPAGTYNLYFTDGACGGPPLLEAGTDVLFGIGHYTTDGVIRYFSPASVAPMPLLSAITVQTDGTLGPCSPVSLPLVVAPALTGSAPALTPPFSVVDVLPVSPAPATATFLDVPTDNPYFRYVEALVASGITAGCGGGNYCPNSSLTRGQMAVFLAKALGL